MSAPDSLSVSVQRLAARNSSLFERFVRLKLWAIIKLAYGRGVYCKRQGFMAGVFIVKDRPIS